MKFRVTQWFEKQTIEILLTIQKHGRDYVIKINDYVIERVNAGQDKSKDIHKMIEYYRVMWFDADKNPAEAIFPNVEKVVEFLEKTNGLSNN